jgi:mersacidin/lichenicidin family type 2 lantibiotic
MSTAVEVNITRAWSDEHYRSELSPEELASLPADPSGEILSLADQDTDVFAVSESPSCYPNYCT